MQNKANLASPSFRGTRNLLLTPPFGKIFPRRIHGLYQRHFLSARPSLYLLFPRNGAHCVPGLFEAYEPADVVPTGEADYQLMLVFVHSFRQVGCHTYVEGARPAGHDVYKELFLQ